jgi:glycerophosphoryl diester phosphodiesterase
MARLVDLGVDGIMTDRPRLLEAELEATASRWDPA